VRDAVQSAGVFICMHEKDLTPVNFCASYPSEPRPPHEPGRPQG
jgi:hypothetical protein